MITQTIAGHKLTLEEDIRYFAHRPLCGKRNIDRQRFTVTITSMHNGTKVEAIQNLTYDEANNFLAEFNNEACSLSGRVW